MTKPLPKSLHTVTVLTKLAVHFARVDEQPLDHAMERLLRVLGYDEAPAYGPSAETLQADPYGLVHAAMQQAEKAVKAHHAELKAEWDEQVAREEREADRCIDVSHK